MSSDVLLEVSGLSKKFCKSLRHSLYYGVRDIAGEVFPPIARDPLELRSHEFWALRDIDFQLRRGECLGVVGRNGAGKSTLLKIITGLLRPDSGHVRVRGRVGALIALGAGFNPILTGRENVYVNGQVLGMTAREVAACFDAIVEFAEIGEFIDSPVKDYSSGMRVRLGFAIAVHLEPDVLVLDEVLAVGDAAFRAKCYDAISEKLRDCAVLFVSHNMYHVHRVSNSVLVLERGKPAELFPNPAEGIERYFGVLFPEDSSQSVQHATGHVRLENLEPGPDSTFTCQSGQPLKVSFDLSAPGGTEDVIVQLIALSIERTPVALSEHTLEVGPQAQRVSFASPALTLGPGRYHLSLTVHSADRRSAYVWYHCYASFRVEGSNYITPSVMLLGAWSAEGDGS